MQVKYSKIRKSLLTKKVGLSSKMCKFILFNTLFYNSYK